MSRTDAGGFGSAVLGQMATLSLRIDDTTGRTIHGIVSASQAIGAASSQAAFHLRLEPRFVLRKRRRTNRVFQTLTVREIIDKVLDTDRLPRHWNVARELSRRVYCVQHQETDYAFVTRLCAEEGLFFGFEHGSSEARETMVFSDSAEHYAPIDGPPELLFRAPNEKGGLELREHHVQRFRLREAVRTNAVLLRGFDPERPPLQPFDSASTEGTPRLDGVGPMRTMVDRMLTIYDHEDSREATNAEKLSASSYLEGERADELVGRGESICRRLLPGRRFRLSEHDLPDADGDYVVTRIEHFGSAASNATSDEPVYRNRFSCVHASVPFRPRRPRPRVRQGMETATVVGPPGQPIHTDELGRVKVQFHWDLDGQLDDRSSCWLRVSQTWAGSGFGTQFLPRVGMEVLVGFIGGDPDRPIVTGCLYNGVTPTPWSLPRDNTRSGLMTRSTPGPGPAHELSFQDRTGEEEVVLKSAKTLFVSAVADATLQSGSDLRIASGGSRRSAVELDAIDAIGGSSAASVGGNFSTNVVGDTRLEVGGGRKVMVNGSEEHRTSGSRTELIGSGRYSVVGGSEGAADDIYSVSGNFRVGAHQAISLESAGNIDLRVGKSRLSIQPNRIVIESEEISIQAKKSITALQGPTYDSSSLVLKGGASLSAGKVSVASGEGATLVLDADAKLDGALVKLNCGAGSAGGGRPIGDDGQRGHVRFRVLKDGLPPEVTSVTLVVSTPSGEIVEKECVVGGEVSFEGRPNDRFMLVETRVKGLTATVEQVSDEENQND